MNDPVQKTCIICGTATTAYMRDVFDTRFGIDRSFDIDRCAHCDLFQTNPLPKGIDLKELYEKYYNFSGEKGTTYARLRHAILFSRLYRLWLFIDGDIGFQAKRGRGKLLDIGCNEGRGLQFFRKNGFTAEGLELNAVAATAARSLGFIVHAELVENYHPPDGYDVAVLSNVLEHSLDPKGMILHVSRILKPGGQVWISCPNNQSWLRSIFGIHWINWHVPFHVMHFSASSLTNLLDHAGFDTVEVRQETPALWVAHSIIARLFARRGRATRQLRNPLIVLLLMLFVRLILFPMLWMGNRTGRGDCLVVTARKR